MAQSTTDPFTTPVVRNQLFSLFKSTGEDTMNPTAATTSKPATKSTGAAAKATRQAKLAVVRPTDEQPTQQQEQEQQQEQQPVNTQPATQLTPAEYQALKAQERAIREQLKANRPAKAEKAAKQPKTLESVITAQLTRPRSDAPAICYTYLRQRMAAGQDRDEALDQVLAQLRSIVLGVMESREPGEHPYHAVLRYLGRAQADAPTSDDTSDDSSDQQQ